MLTKYCLGYDLSNFEADINTTQISLNRSISICSNLRWKPHVLESNKNKIPSFIFENSLPECLKIDGCDNYLNCEHDSCETYPCDNRGVCVNLDSKKFKCVCFADYKGPLCRKNNPINKCVESFETVDRITEQYCVVPNLCEHGRAEARMDYKNFKKTPYMIWLI